MLMLRTPNQGQAGGAQPLSPCPGFDCENRMGCVCGCLGCHEGPPANVHDYPRGANPVLAYFYLLAGTTQLLGVTGELFLPRREWNGSGAALFLNDGDFTDGQGAPRTVWAVSVEKHEEESLHVMVFGSRTEAYEAYRDVVTFGERFTDCDVQEHGYGEPCCCGEDDHKVVAARQWLRRTEHCLLSTFPRPRCMCGTPLLHPGSAGVEPTLNQHLDEVREWLRRS